jgi:predicted transposase/invertase (TIGR01784 family)
MMFPDEAAQEYREKAKRDHVTLLNAAETRGETRGKDLGAAQKSAEIARKLKHMGLSLEAIEKATGLDTEAIKRL